MPHSSFPRSVSWQFASMAGTTNLSPSQLDHLRMESSQSANTMVASPQESSFVANPVPSRIGSADGSMPLGHSNRTLVLCFDGTGDQ